jgi:hypothetical protein
MMKELGIASAILFLVLSTMIAVVGDAGFAVSLSPGFYLFAALPLLVALLAWREQVVRVAMVAYLIVLLTLPFVTFSPVKPFTWFFSDIREGMREPEVMDALSRRFPSDGRFPRPVSDILDDESLWFQLDPNQGAYNAEIVIVKMKNGRVMSKEYFPD